MEQCSKTSSPERAFTSSRSDEPEKHNNRESPFISEYNMQIRPLDFQFYTAEGEKWNLRRLSLTIEFV